MSENCRGTEKSDVGNESKSSMSNILNMIMSVFSMMKQPADTLPPPLVMIGSKLRPGLSGRDMAARVISRFSESDAVSGQVFQEGNNVMTALVVIIMEEIVNAIQTEAKVTSAIDPGSILIQSNGIGFAGFPVSSVGTNPSIVSGNGVIQ